ncbi:MAG: hypothetical protein MI924_31495 [Chloroflexales bacterium]|nr:hypothetical protein [Chloroflexales bacterium]
MIILGQFRDVEVHCGNCEFNGTEWLEHLNKQDRSQQWAMAYLPAATALILINLLNLSQECFPSTLRQSPKNRAVLLQKRLKAARRGSFRYDSPAARSINVELNALR